MTNIQTGNKQTSPKAKPAILTMQYKYSTPSLLVSSDEKDVRTWLRSPNAKTVIQFVFRADIPQTVKNR